MKDYVIGVDIGTTSTKAVLYDKKGNVKGYANKEYPLYQEIPDMAEQDPDEIFETVIDVLTAVVRKSGADVARIAGVSFSSAMHSLILLDEENQLLTRCITWAYNRANHQSEELKNSAAGLAIYYRTGTPIHPMSPLSKILWLKEEHPDLIQQTAHFIGIKEYVFYKLFGQFKVDFSIASATGLFNIHELRWDDEVLALLDISNEQLSELV